MPRRAAPLLFVATGLGSLILGLALRAPWRDAGAPLPKAHVDQQLVDGLRQLQVQAAATGALPAAEPSAGPAAARAQAWLQRQTAQVQQAVLAAAPERLPGLLARRNPYQLPGCLTAGAVTKGSVDEGSVDEGSVAGSRPVKPDILCGKHDHAVPDWNTLVPAAADLGGQLAGLRLPGSGAGSDHTLQVPVSAAQPALVTPLRQGPDIRLTLDQQAQADAQALLMRMTARLPKPDPVLAGRLARFEESARARRLGLLVLDVETGAIEVIASSHSPCYAQSHGAAAAPATPCLAMPPQLSASPLNLRNAALYADAMPGSLVKLMQGLTLLERGTPAAALGPELLRSDTEAVIDRLLCKPQGFAPACANAHIAHLARRAGQLGPQRLDLLAPLGRSPHTVFGSRLLARPDSSAPWPALADSGPASSAAQAMRACHQHGAKHRWRQCQGADLVNTVAELFGQGHARATPIGIATQWLQVARLAQGAAAGPAPHLVQGAALAMPPVDAVPGAANTLLALLGASHIHGTSRSACRAALAYADAAHRLSCSGPTAGLRIASKTGTPVWRADKATHAQWLDGCARLPVAAPAGPGAAQAHGKALTDCRLSPIKWWAAAVGDELAWRKVVVVFAERNWQRSGWIDARGDIGPNVAAEAGLAFIQAQRQRWLAPG